MSKYIICQSFKKFHRGVFSIAYPKYINFGGILSCNNVAPVTNTMEQKKKLQLKHKNSLFTLQTFHYNYY